MKNLQLIAFMFIGDVDKCISFFDQSFVLDAETVDEEETPTVPPN